MDTERGRELKTDSTRVNDRINIKRAHKTGGQFF